MALKEQQLLDIQKNLEKRQTFKQGVRDLTQAVCGVELGNPIPSLQQAFPLIARVHQLLKARHTNVDFWRTGDSLFVTCLHLKFSPEQLSKLRQFHKDASEFLQEESGGATSSSGNGQPDQQGSDSSTMQGSQLSEAGLLDLLSGAPPPPESHYDDAGPIIDETSERWRRAQTSGDQAGTGAEAGADGQQQQRSRGELRREMQRQILEGIQAIYSGMEAVTHGTEAIGRELDSVLGLLGRGAEGGPQQRPPASKKVLAALPVLEATEEKLAEWGPECVCAVCTCEVSIGDKVQVLPCRHMYHPACVAPWLQKNNSCPTCRTELPTDDPHYEARKEREAEEAAERRGAANAVRGGEYMYV